MSDGDDLSEPRSGYRQPPVSTRFRKGKSGNPQGRPRGRHRQIPYDTVLGQMVTVREDGREHRVTAAEAFLLHLTQKGLAGDTAAAREALAAIEAARTRRGDDREEYRVTRVIISPFGVGPALEALGMAVKRYPRDEERVHWKLQPWIVEVALARLGSRQLALAEQREVWHATRTPRKVKWPDWWAFRG